MKQMMVATAFSHTHFITRLSHRPLTFSNTGAQSILPGLKASEYMCMHLCTHVYEVGVHICQVTLVQLMRSGIGRNVCCTVGNFVHHLGLPCLRKYLYYGMSNSRNPTGSSLTPTCPGRIHSKKWTAYYTTGSLGVNDSDCLQDF